MQITITPEEDRDGRVFEGLGAVSAGASSRLLIDYPEPQRSQILDYLFLPAAGAALQHLKVEIGGDTNSTDGSEPSHKRDRDDACYTRGYEWWLMKEAKRRNPAIILEALQWGAPGWIGEGHFYSQDNADFIVDFLAGAKTHHGLDIAFVGIWNEMRYDTDWIKRLKRTLRDHGLTTRIVAADGKWDIVGDLAADAELYDAVDVVGIHYPYPGGDSPVGEAQSLRKPLWASEDGAWNRVEGPNSGEWSGAAQLAKVYNRNYIELKVTKTLVWSPISSYYDVVMIPGSGLMYANEPWSGHYRVQHSIWVTAHTTQFVQPGWRYLESACGDLPAGGSVVTLAAPTENAYSVVIETVDARTSQRLDVRVTGALGDAPVHIWRTNAHHTFEHLDTVQPVEGSLTLDLDPASVYTLSTTSGQSAGSGVPIPAAASFPFPYVEDFSAYARGATPRYFADQEGTFEVDETATGERCLAQVVTQAPIPWTGNFATPDAPAPTPAENMALPYSIVGDMAWTDYDVTADVLLRDDGFITVLARVTEPPEGAWTPPGAYRCMVWSGGRVELQSVASDGPVTIIAEGTVPFALDTWHTVTLRVEGPTITATIDNVQVCEGSNDTYRRGLAGLGSGWHHAFYRTFRVTPLV